MFSFKHYVKAWLQYFEHIYIVIVVAMIDL